MWVGTVPRFLYISFSFLPANCNCAQQEKCPFVAEQMFLRRNPPPTAVTRLHNFSHGGIKAAERPFRKRERSETQNGCRESKCGVLECHVRLQTREYCRKVYVPRCNLCVHSFQPLNFPRFRLMKGNAESLCTLDSGNNSFTCRFCPDTNESTLLLSNCLYMTSSAT